MEDQQQGSVEGSCPSSTVQDGVVQLGGRRQIDEPGEASYSFGDSHQCPDLE